jgi:hypothetical protein
MMGRNLTTPTAEKSRETESEREVEFGLSGKEAAESESVRASPREDETQQDDATGRCNRMIQHKPHSIHDNQRQKRAQTSQT